MAPRLLLLCALLTAAAGCGSDTEEPARPAAPAAPLAELLVRVDADGPRGPGKAKELRARCTSPQESAACTAAAKLAPRDFEPVPGDVACTDIFGGPETARISGTLRGDPVSATFARSDGCQIRRWDAVAPLLEQLR